MISSHCFSHLYSWTVTFLRGDNDKIASHWPVSLTSWLGTSGAPVCTPAVAGYSSTADPTAGMCWAGRSTRACPPAGSCSTLRSPGQSEVSSVSGINQSEVRSHLTLGTHSLRLELWGGAHWAAVSAAIALTRRGLTTWLGHNGALGDVANLVADLLDHLGTGGMSWLLYCMFYSPLAQQWAHSYTAVGCPGCPHSSGRGPSRSQPSRCPRTCTCSQSRTSAGSRSRSSWAQASHWSSWSPPWRRLASGHKPSSSNQNTPAYSSTDKPLREYSKTK